MRIPLAWHNTFQNKKRTLAAIGGITFSLVLIFMQLGFLTTARITAALVYDFFDYDLIITSAVYESMNSAGDFDKTRLYQARAIPGVGETATLNYERARWRDPENDDLGSSCMLLGFDLNPHFLRDKATIDKLHLLNLRNSVILDEWSHPDYGNRPVGKRATINHRNVNIAALYQLGISFHAEGSAIVSLETFQSLVRPNPRKCTFGLVKVAPGSDIQTVKRQLAATLPADVLVFDRQEFIRAEQDYFIKVKPIGIMFQAGAFVAFAVGAVILFQILSTEISNRLREYATLKAMGFSKYYIYKVGGQQSLLFAMMSFIPALPLGHGVAFLVKKASRLPMYLTWELALFVFVLALLMCLISGTLALGKVRKAAPADLF
jgi:putative ABC transport system permease protein